MAPIPLIFRQYFILLKKAKLYTSLIISLIAASKYFIAQNLKELQRKMYKASIDKNTVVARKNNY